MSLLPIRSVHIYLLFDLVSGGLITRWIQLKTGLFTFPLWSVCQSSLARLVWFSSNNTWQNTWQSLLFSSHALLGLAVAVVLSLCNDWENYQKKHLVRQARQSSTLDHSQMHSRTHIHSVLSLWDLSTK